MFGLGSEDAIEGMNPENKIFWNLFLLWSILLFEIARSTLAVHFIRDKILGSSNNVSQNAMLDLWKFKFFNWFFYNLRST